MWMLMQFKLVCILVLQPYPEIIKAVSCSIGLTGSLPTLATKMTLVVLNINVLSTQLTQPTGTLPLNAKPSIDGVKAFFAVNHNNSNNTHGSCATSVKLMQTKPLIRRFYHNLTALKQSLPVCPSYFCWINWLPKSPFNLLIASPGTVAFLSHYQHTIQTSKLTDSDLLQACLCSRRQLSQLLPWIHY